MIRFLYHQEPFDQKRYDSTVLSIREAREKINMHLASPEKNIVLYCIDTLFEIINEGNKQKIIDFADAIHNIPEIYTHKRNLYSFRKELKAFQKKYGKQYFAFISEVHLVSSHLLSVLLAILSSLFLALTVESGLLCASAIISPFYSGGKDLYFLVGICALSAIAVILTFAKNVGLLLDIKNRKCAIIIDTAILIATFFPFWLLCELCLKSIF